MSMEEILDIAKYYYTMGTEHKRLSHFPNFTASTTEPEKSVMIDEAIAKVNMNKSIHVDAKVIELCESAEHFFLSEYRAGLLNAPAIAKVPDAQHDQKGSATL